MDLGRQFLQKMVLRPENRMPGGFSALFGPSEIELVHSLDRVPNKTFENRLWGDPGYIHLCFDVRGMSALRSLCRE